MFKKAEKKKSKLRLAIEGASGSGKTYSGLILAKSIGKKIAVIDTENGSASLYSDDFDFDVLELAPPYTPERYIEGIKAAEQSGYDVILIDSISHEWSGEGGCLDIVNHIGGNSYTAWGKVTPRHDKFINAILRSSAHVICTMRSKAAYDTGKDDRGKMTIQKKGTAPIQRESVDYEFTIVFDLNQKHYAIAAKDRTKMFDNKDFMITQETGDQIINWLNSGVEVVDNEKTTLIKEFKKTVSGMHLSAAQQDFINDIDNKHIDQIKNSLDKIILLKRVDGAKKTTVLPAEKNSADEEVKTTGLPPKEPEEEPVDLF